MGSTLQPFCPAALAAAAPRRSARLCSGIRSKEQEWRRLAARMLGVSRRGLPPVASLGHRTKRVPRAALVALRAPADEAVEVQ
jgi:hypothetical protein